MSSSSSSCFSGSGFCCEVCLLITCCSQAVLTHSVTTSLVVSGVGKVLKVETDSSVSCGSELFDCLGGAWVVNGAVGRPVSGLVTVLGAGGKFDVRVVGVMHWGKIALYSGSCGANFSWASAKSVVLYHPGLYELPPTTTGSGFQ